MTKNYLAMGLMISLMACQSEPTEQQHTHAPLVTEVMTADKQSEMNFEDVMNDLIAGNDRFIHSNLTPRDNIAQLEQLTDGQHPKAVVLSCIDSRVPVEEVFDQGIGDLFVIRVAGNIDNDHNIASIEYGCKVSGAKVFLVLGHEECGAIKSAVKGVDMGNITELLSHIQPIIDKHDEFVGPKDIENPDFMELITKDNALMTLDDIRQKSPMLKEMEDKEELLLVAAYYDMHTGKVTIVNEEDVHTHMHHQKELLKQQ